MPSFGARIQYSGGVSEPYPRPIPENRWRDLYWESDRFRCVQLSDRDFIKGTLVQDGGDVAIFPSRPTGQQYTSGCRCEINTGLYDWGTTDKSFIFSLVTVNGFYSGAYNVMYMRRGRTQSPGLAWEICLDDTGNIYCGGDGVSYIYPSLGIEVGKQYQVGLVLDRVNERYKAAATEYSTEARVEVEGDLPANWVGHGFSTSEDAPPSIGSWTPDLNTSSNRKAFNGELGDVYVYDRALGISEI